MTEAVLREVRVDMMGWVMQCRCHALPIHCDLVKP